MRPRLAASLFLSAAVLAGPACLDPTQVTLEISTDASCSVVGSDGVDVHVGSPESVATPQAQVISTASCSPGAGPDGENRVGSLVVVPSDSGDMLGLTVVLGVDRRTDQCVIDKPDGCIVARRSVRYVTHRSLRLPISLRTDCLGVSCPGDQTCVHGACVSALVDSSACTDGVCGENAPDAGAPCSTDLATDPLNCGQCGFDCAGGECNGGVCSLYPPGTQAVPLAPGACLTVAGGKVYFTTGAVNQSGDVLSVPTGGGAPEYVAAGVPGGTFGITSDAKDIYYASGGALVPVSTGASLLIGGPYGPVASDGKGVCVGVTSPPGRIECVGAGTVMSSAQGTPVKLAMGGGYVYSTWTSGDVWRSSTLTSAPTRLATGQASPDGIVIVAPGQQEYFSARGAGQVDLILEGQPPVVKPAGVAVPGPRGLAYDAASASLYVADDGAGGAGAIWRAKGGTTTRLALAKAHPDCIAVDATGVYWLEGDVPAKVHR